MCPRIPLDPQSTFTEPMVYSVIYVCIRNREFCLRSIATAPSRSHTISHSKAVRVRPYGNHSHIRCCHASSRLLVSQSRPAVITGTCSQGQNDGHHSQHQTPLPISPSSKQRHPTLPYCLLTKILQYKALLVMKTTNSIKRQFYN